MGFRFRARGCCWHERICVEKKWHRVHTGFTRSLLNLFLVLLYEPQTELEAPECSSSEETDCGYDIGM